MKMKHKFLFLFAAILIFCTPQFSKGSIEIVPADEADRVLKEIFAKNIDMYHKYKGIKCLRTEAISEYDPKTNKLLSVSEITVMRTDYFYEKPVAEIKSYKKDGKVMEPSKFDSLILMPSFPVFDEKGRDNYDIRITEKKIFNGRECYVVQATPKKETISAIRNGRYASRLNEARKEGQLIGLTGVPLFIIENKHKIVGAQPIETFRNLLDKIK